MKESAIYIVENIFYLLEIKWIIFISGIICGIFVSSIMSNKTNEYLNTIKDFLKDIIDKVCKHPIEWILGTIITIIVICQFITSNPTEENSFELLNFISSVALAWIMTKYSVKNEFEDRQKENCAMSYSYSNNIQNKLKRSIRVCDLTSIKLKLCECSKNQCDLKDNVDIMKHILIGINEDVSQNTKNWANNISEEIDLIDEIRKEDNKIKDKESKIQPLSEDVPKENVERLKLEKEIKEIKENIIKLKENIKPNIRYMLINTNQEGDEYICELDNEILQQEAEVERKKRGIGKKASQLKPREEQKNSHEDSAG